METEAFESAAGPLPERQSQLFQAPASDQPKRQQQALRLQPDDVKRCNIAVLECQDNLAFLREQPNDKFKLIVTSPPYNNGKSYESR